MVKGEEEYSLKKAMLRVFELQSTSVKQLMTKYDQKKSFLILMTELLFKFYQLSTTVTSHTFFSRSNLTSYLQLHSNLLKAGVDSDLSRHLLFMEQLSAEQRIVTEVVSGET